MAQGKEVLEGELPRDGAAGHGQRRDPTDRIQAARVGSELR